MFWNPAAESMFGYPESEVIGKKLHNIIVGPKMKEKVRAGLADFAKTGKGPVLDIVIEMEAVRKSGEVFPVERSVASFKLRDKWYAVGSVRDITARKQSEKRLTEMATIDALTGLSNRRHFLEQAELYLRQAIRYQRNFSLMMFDLDHFKKINDTHGHDAGDRVLRAVAESAKRELRDTDIIGRIGGEEFAVAMPETDLESAMAAAERLRVGLMNTEVDIESRLIRFTVSIGVTQLDSEIMKLSDMMKIADGYLYTAKENGRNRVVAAT
jgi:diguanylate cyclase (GGDEF)-like protein/PAS domain S-box-containing protein